MKFKCVLSTLVFLGLLSGQVSATNANIGTYNLILQNDLSIGSEIEGRVIIGGDIVSKNTIVIGNALDSDTSVDAVTVVGDINAPLTINNGHNVVYGSTINGINLNGGGSATKSDITTLQSEFDAIWDGIEADSAYYASLDANAGFAGDSQNPKLGSSDSSELTVYEFSTEDLTSAINYLFATTPAVPVVINVDLTGLTSLEINAKFNIQDSEESNVLWNFYSTDGIVTELSFNGSGWAGSILAPYANVSSGTGALDGALAALSFDGNVELHNSLYSYEPPTSPPPSEVPAPTGLAMLGLGLLLMVRQKRANKV